MARRTLLRTGLAAAAGAVAGSLTGCTATPTGPGGPTHPGSAQPSGGPTAGAPVPTTPAQLTFTAGRTLQSGAHSASYHGQLLATVSSYLQPTAQNPKHPGYPGAVVLTAVDGMITVHGAVGDALRYGVGPVELAPVQRVAMCPDSIFDLASITKVFTALLVLQQAERGVIELEAPVADYLAEFRSAGKRDVTVSMLLAHTSGLPVGVSVAGLPSLAAKNAAVLATPLLPGAVPGRVFRYSGTGIIVLGLLLERLTGRRLDVLCRDELTGPLGMTDTGFAPRRWLSATDAAARLVATDARPIRGLLRGEVHDPIAHHLGDVAGHAGLFGTAADLAVLGQLLLNGGEYTGRRLLTEDTVRRMLVNVNAGKPAVDAERPGRSSTHGLGVELHQPWFMGRLAGPLTFGHTGFTGTALIVDPVRRLVLVLLTNRAHPNWTWANPDPPRVAVSNVLADALPSS